MGIQHSSDRSIDRPTNQTNELLCGSDGISCMNVFNNNNNKASMHENKTEKAKYKTTPKLNRSELKKEQNEEEIRNKCIYEGVK